MAPTPPRAPVTEITPPAAESPGAGRRCRRGTGAKVSRDHVAGQRLVEVVGDAEAAGERRGRSRDPRGRRPPAPAHRARPRWPGRRAPRAAASMAGDVDQQRQRRRSRSRSAAIALRTSPRTNRQPRRGRSARPSAHRGLGLGVGDEAQQRLRRSRAGDAARLRRAAEASAGRRASVGRHRCRRAGDGASSGRCRSAVSAQPGGAQSVDGVPRRAGRRSPVAAAAIPRRRRAGHHGAQVGLVDAGRAPGAGALIGVDAPQAQPASEEREQQGSRRRIMAWLLSSG